MLKQVNLIVQIVLYYNSGNLFSIALHMLRTTYFINQILPLLNYSMQVLAAAIQGRRLFEGGVNKLPFSPGIFSTFCLLLLF